MNHLVTISTEWVNPYMTDTLIFLCYCVLAYLIGSIPVGYLVAKARGVDISQVGSGNMGATNITRNLGSFLGATVGVLDFLKGFLPALLISRVYGNQDWHLFAVSILPVVGHIFPIWLNFKGGKGVATIFGILAAYFGLPLFLAFLLIWYLVVRVVKIISLVNLIVALLLPLAFWFTYQYPSYILFGVLLGMVIWWSHRENIRRLLAGTEHQAGY